MEQKPAMSKLAERLWRVSERKPIQPDVIVPLSYAMLPNALAFGTTQGIHAAYGWATQFPSAVVAFGNPSHCFPGSEIAEEREKMQLLQTLGLPEERIISGGPIQNTVTELRAVAAALKQRGTTSFPWSAHFAQILARDGVATRPSFFLPAVTPQLVYGEHITPSGTANLGD